RCYDPLHVSEALDGATVDIHDDVANLEAGIRGNALGNQTVNPGDRAGLAVVQRHARENQGAENEVCDRSGCNDRGALADRFVVEAAFTLFRRHGVERLRRRRRRLAVVTEELDVAAERNRRNLPARAVPVVESRKLRPKAQREGQHLHAGPACDQEMAELVKENDDGEDEEEGNDIAEEPMAQRIDTMKKILGHPTSP
ncbi:hypothetical protein chiPu_0030606, partial [Chiloscyllium punctatum]|nr:hypothetical protein [Chiloscyllium punctatum]